MAAIWRVSTIPLLVFITAHHAPKELGRRMLTVLIANARAAAIPII